MSEIDAAADESTAVVKRPLDIVVLAGGISHERDISIRSGRRVADALQEAGHRVIVRDPDASLLPYLAANRPDVVFPALHGSSGEDGSLFELLHGLGLAVVGSRGEAARLAWRKPAASEVVARAGVAVPDNIVLSHETFRELGAPSVLEVLRSAMPGEVVVKPGSGGSAQGVSIVSSTDELPRAMVEAFVYDDVAIVERRILGTEIAVTVVDEGDGPVALPAVEIVPTGGVYTFQARYTAGETTFYAPSRLPDDHAEAAARAAITAHGALGLGDLSRIDFIVDEDGTPWFLEANVVPGLTETSIAPLAIRAAGRTQADVYDVLVAHAASRSA
ncbi:D-alanine--D-alanine ligase family protein [Agromyces seonyuensis]|uniref:D-alanine--D-alanine ligase n=1 Tax=Agromyces seonyuensis TaxID=2662446 RepID=A0A6I4P2C9_9MICO|nr:D-alanine--D-alanine ligase [Agromyces seonyuensis]MWB97437.1 D-alanine--D-alanine ligase [Agromyces seonyuensis]